MLVDARDVARLFAESMPLSGRAHSAMMHQGAMSLIELRDPDSDETADALAAAGAERATITREGPITAKLDAVFAPTTATVKKEIAGKIENKAAAAGSRCAPL